MNAEEKILYAGYEDVIIFQNFSYDSALIGISHDNRAIYDYEKMIDWLIKEEGFTNEEAIEWIDYNTIRALPYTDNSPIILFPLEDFLD